jgi:hypothetical protein
MKRSSDLADSASASRRRNDVSSTAPFAKAFSSDVVVGQGLDSSVLHTGVRRLRLVIMLS